MTTNPVLVDANVWIDHLRRAEPAMDALLGQRRVLMHPFVLGEVALGSLRGRKQVLGQMAQLLEVVVALHDEVLQLIEAGPLFGRGIGFIDAHLLASVRLTPNTRLWTRDRRLRALAADLGLCADLA